MRAAGDQVKTACGNLQLCAGLEASIEGDRRGVGQRRLVRVRERREEAEEAEEAEETEEKEEHSEGIVASLSNLIIETATIEGEAAEGLAVALDIEVKEERNSEGGKKGGGTLRALEALEFLNQEAEPSGNTLVDAHNGFNELSRLAIMCTVRHRWPTEARFVFNCYWHWAQLLLR